ncbi:MULTISPECIES: hypothetical protein [unclassified Microcoleus]
MPGILYLATAAASGRLRQRISIGNRCSGILLPRAIVLPTGDR